jgi:hypothetical protein
MGRSLRKTSSNKVPKEVRECVKRIKISSDIKKRGLEAVLVDIINDPLMYKLHVMR